MKTCYYELLGVETTASESDLRKAYRRKALQYHPDKNPGNIEETTAVFATIRAAYEVLADPQERAWYDSHKTQILSDDLDGFNGGYSSDNEFEAETSVTGITTDDLLKFFNSGLYSRMDDSPAGFYQIAGKVFAKLASEEVRFARMQGLEKFDKYEDGFFEADILNQGYRKAYDKYASAGSTLFPAFGDSTAPFQNLRSFYRDWSSFSTVKTFSWKDEYMYSRNYDRRTKREIKKRNEKLRQQAKSEYNKTVKRYVSFIKKFDSRMKEGAAKFEQDKRKKMREDLQRQIEKDRQARLQDAGDPFKLQSWQTVEDFDWSEIEKNYDRDHKLNNADEESSDEIVVFECFVCHKTFKSEGQLENHYSTKLHKKNLQQLQREMRKDNMTLGLDAVSDVDEFNSAAEDVSQAEDDGKMDLDAIEDELKRIEQELEDMSDDEDLPESDEGSSSSSVAGGDAAEAKLELDSDSKIELDAPDVAFDSEQHSLEDQKDSDGIGLESEDDELTKLLASLKLQQSGSCELSSKSEDEWGDSSKKAKRKPKNTKKSAKSTSPSPTSTKTTQSYQCNQCATSYTSRNALFDHIKREKHSTAVPKSKTKKKSKKTKK
ncbi:LAME_0G07184g1_1 [Lachancea meyersii CBS 8951]|uniref:LAME_0G07184g1_1 n=1 Tax=Lachancea meyersii CBS 8951 TaxID=1266667 RepID=A0A1G4K7V0_9SACH|nr:LAME_0G07184g1_1 [Lachancea meyersii CBS 8951]